MTNKETTLDWLIRYIGNRTEASRADIMHAARAVGRSTVTINFYLSSAALYGYVDPKDCKPSMHKRLRQVPYLRRPRRGMYTLSSHGFNRYIAPSDNEEVVVEVVGDAADVSGIPQVPKMHSYLPSNELQNEIRDFLRASGLDEVTINVEVESIGSPSKDDQVFLTLTFEDNLMPLEDIFELTRVLWGDDPSADPDDWASHLTVGVDSDSGNLQVTAVGYVEDVEGRWYEPPWKREAPYPGMEWEAPDIFACGLF